MSYQISHITSSLIVSSFLAIIQPEVMLCSSTVPSEGVPDSDPKFNHLVKVVNASHIVRLFFPSVKSFPS